MKFNTRPPAYKPRKNVPEEWKSFRKGLNLLVRQTELDNEELAKAQDILLVGKGVPTGRWGTVKHFLAGATGTSRGFGTYKSNDGTTNELLTLVDEGFLYKQNSTSSTRITGQSWPSGSEVHMEQLGGSTYIVSADADFTSYTGGSLTIFSQIASPTGLAATNFSGVSGTNRVSYQVLAVGANGGQTLPGTNYVLANLPNDLRKTQVNLV